jgi:ribosome-associated protein
MEKQIILKELKYSFARSAGSGGQHVNKVETKVHLSFDVKASMGLSIEEKAVILDKLQNRITLKGILNVESSKSRSQLKNKKTATNRFFDIISEALTPEKVRKKSKPTASMIDKRLKAKKQHSEKKNQRKKVKLPKQFDLFLFKCVSFVWQYKI